MRVGEDDDLDAEICPPDAVNQLIRWTSTNTAVVWVKKTQRDGSLVFPRTQRDGSLVFPCLGGHKGRTQGDGSIVLTKPTNYSIIIVGDYYAKTSS